MANPFEGFSAFAPSVPRPRDEISRLRSLSLQGFQIERVVRPFVRIDSEPPAPPTPRKPIPGEGGEAFIVWGRSSNFASPAITDPVTDASGAPGIKVKFPKDPKDEEDPEEEDETISEYQELERTVSKIRVENPSDPAQFVMVERVETILFRGPEGRRVRFKFANK